MRRHVLGGRWLVFSVFFALAIVCPAARAQYTWTERTAPGSRLWMGMASSSDGTKLAAAPDAGCIYTSTDSGVTWTEQTASDSRDWSNIASSSDGTKLTAVVYNGYIYTSSDSGATWTERTAPGSRQWVGIACSSDGTKWAAGARSSYIYTSTDSGATWTQQTGSGSRGWRHIASSSDGTKLAATIYTGLGGGYIYTSTDSGVTWTERTASGSRDWTPITSSSDGTKLVAGAYNGYIYTSTDSGANWTERTGAGSRQWRYMASTPDGTTVIAVAGFDYIRISTDSGATWTAQAAAGSRDWSSVASSSDATKLVAGVYNGHIYTGVIPAAPTVTTTPVSNITDTTAASGGNVTDDGGASVTARGVCWSTSANPTTADDKTVDGSGTGSFTSSITGLSPETTYHVRAYATNSVDTSYGSDESFTTDQPTVQFTAASQSGAEDVGTMTVTAQLSGASGLDVTVPYTLSGTAADPADYTITASPVTIPAGELTAAITITVVDDALDELDETVIVTMGTPTNATKGATDEHTATITDNDAPLAVTTTAVSNITTTTADCGGNVTADGGADVTVRGVCWSTSANPTTADDKTSDGTGTGSFTSNITDLDPDTTYHVRAYATNSVGTAYGADVPFTTTAAVNPILQYDFEGNVQDSSGNGRHGTVQGTVNYAAGYTGQALSLDGNGWVDMPNNVIRGNPTLTISLRFKTTAYGGILGYQNEAAENPLPWEYVPILAVVPPDGLPEGATGKLRAEYWTTAGGLVVLSENAVNDGYWHQVVLSATPTKIVVYLDGIFQGEQTGNMNHLNMQYNQTGTARIRTPGGTDPWRRFTGLLDDLVITTDYLPIVTTQAVTNIGTTTATGNGNITNLGNPNPTQHGVCWSTSQNPTVTDDKTEEGPAGSTGPFTSAITGLSAGATYHVRAYATNIAGTSYGSDVEFTTDTTPTVTTTAISNITVTTAESGGNVTDDGGDAVTGRGVCWSTSANPTTADDKTSDGTGTGSFTSNITGLDPDTTYHVRAYATNSEGTAYGDDVTFTTGALQPEPEPEAEPQSEAVPDLRVTIECAAEQAGVGNDVTFGVSIENVGDGAATDVLLTVPLPENTEFVSASLITTQAAQAAPIDACVVDGQIVIEVGNMAPGEDVQIELVLRALVAGKVTVRASATSEETPTPASAQTTAEVDVEDVYWTVIETITPIHTCGVLGIMPVFVLLGLMGLKTHSRKRGRTSAETARRSAGSVMNDVNVEKATTATGATGDDDAT